MKKLLAVLTALLIVLLSVTSAFADVVDEPFESSDGTVTLIVAVLILAVLAAAIVLIVRAVLKKNKK